MPVPILARRIISRLNRVLNSVLWKIPSIEEQRLIRRAIVGQYYKSFGHQPQLNPPITFNEHIIHRILFDRDPRLKIVCDKIRAKEFIRERVDQSYPVSTLGIWDEPRQITWDRWPERFVLKSNHASGTIAVVPPGPERDIDHLTAKAEQWLAYDYFDVSFEWGYRGMQRRLLAEPLLLSPSGGPVTEVQVFTFHGHAALIRFLTGTKGRDRAQCWFDATGRRLVIQTITPDSDVDLEDDLRTEMVQVAEAIAHDFSSMRVDFFLTADGLRIGELTPYNQAGKQAWRSPELDAVLGRLWNQPLDLSVLDPLEKGARGGGA